MKNDDILFEISKKILNLLEETKKLIPHDPMIQLKLAEVFNSMGNFCLEMGLLKEREEEFQRSDKGRFQPWTM
jgi:hypothetical protein